MKPQKKTLKARSVRFITIYGFEVLNYCLQHAIQSGELLEYLGSLKNRDELSPELLENTDIVVIQIDRSRENSFELCYCLRMQYPETATLLLTTQDLDLFYVAAKAVNARGMLLFQDSVEYIVEQIKRAIGGPVFTTAQLRRIRTWQNRVGEKLHQLSQREWEILFLVVEGYNNREISSALDISKNTVERHLSNLMDKLGLRSRSMITNYYYNNHLNELQSLLRDKQFRLCLFSQAGLDDFNDSPRGDNSI